MSNHAYRISLSVTGTFVVFVEAETEDVAKATAEDDFVL